MFLADDTLLNRFLLVIITVIALSIMVLILIIGYEFFDEYQVKILQALYVAFIVWLTITLFWYSGFLHHDLVRRHLRNEKTRSKIAFEINPLPCPVEESENEKEDDSYTAPDYEQQGRGEDLSSLFEKKWG